MCFACILIDLNLLDWSSQNILAVALAESVYLWNASAGDITQLMKTENPDEYISSVSFTKEGHFLAVGTSDCKVHVSMPYNKLIALNLFRIT